MKEEKLGRWKSNLLVIMKGKVIRLASNRKKKEENDSANDGCNRML